MSASFLLGWMIGVICGLAMGWYLRGAHERELKRRVDSSAKP
jgi:hypothetical protein